MPSCPHCAVAFVEIAADRLPINKASECKHLLRCRALAAGVYTSPVIRNGRCVRPEPVDEELRGAGKDATLMASERDSSPPTRPPRSRGVAWAQMLDKDERLEALDRQIRR